MTGANVLNQAPPHDIEQTIRHLGANLKIARIRRGLTVLQVAEKIGTGVRAVRDAERGKVSTAVSVYVAMMWLYGLLGEFELLADPGRDAVGLSLALRREGTRARPSHEFDNDF